MRLHAYVAMAACGATALAVGAPALASKGSQGARAAATKTVVLKDIAFKPAKLSVKRGTRVTFQWRDGSTPHNVISKGRPKFKSASTRTESDGARPYSVTLRKKGTYRYVCTIHPGMSGRITVR